MPTLELEFNCLFLFAYDKKAESVHVLMPATGNHGPSGHEDHSHHEGSDHPGAAVHRHVVRLMHRSFTEPHNRRDMEGWALVLGNEAESADTSITPVPPPSTGEEVVDLTDVTGGALIDRDLVQDQVHPKIVSRVTLHRGKVTKLDAEATWKIKKRDVFMAYRVAWRIENVPEKLTWIRLGASGNEPLASLADIEHDSLGPNGEKVYRLTLYHTTNEALPPNDRGPLDPKQVRHHFRAFYTLFGITIPDDDDDRLPQIDKSAFIGKVNCGTAKAELEPE